MATAPALFWYQLDTGTLAPTYYGQLNQTVTDLCTENSITAPTAPWWNTIAGTLVPRWLSQIDTAVRSLCVVLSVTPPAVTLPNLNVGQYEAVYWRQLDVCVRALCAAAPAYEGPLDLVPGAVAAYSLRAMIAGSTADAVTIRRSSDSTTQTFALSNNVVSQSAVSSFLGGSSGFITAWKDLSGGGKHALADVQAEEPSWTPNVQNALPGIKFLAPDSNNWNRLNTADRVNIPSGAISVLIVAQRINTVAPQVNKWLCGANNNESVEDPYWEFGSFEGPTYSFRADIWSNPNQAGSLIGNPAIATTGSLHLLEAAWQFGAGAATIDGIDIGWPGNLDSNGAVGQVNQRLTVGSGDWASNPPQSWNGYIVELLVYPTRLSSGDRTALRENIADYYGITI